MSSIGARLDRLPLSKYHYRILGMLGVGLFFDAFDIYLLSGVIAAMIKSGFANTQAVAHIVAVSFVGLFLGTLATGILCDRYGRRTMFIWSLLIYSLGSIACAAGPSYTFILIARFITSVGMGGELVSVYTFFGEIVPPQKRGMWTAILYMVTTVALPIATFIGMIVIPTGAGGWRWMFVLAGIPTFFAYFFQRRMPESPRWYEANGYGEKADKIVSAIEAEIELKTGQKLPPAAVSPSTAAPPKEKQPIWVLFNKVFLKRTVLSIILYVLVSIIAYSFITWLPSIFVRQGLDISKSLAFTTIMVLGTPVGGIVAILISDRVSRKSSTVVLTFLGFIITCAYAFSRDMTLIIILGFIFLALTSAICCIAWWTYVPEIFPTAVRARGTGLGSSLGRLGTAGSTYMVVALTNAFGFSSVMIVLSAMFLIVSVFTFVLGIETKDRSLEDINENALKRALTT